MFAVPSPVPFARGAATPRAREQIAPGQPETAAGKAEAVYLIHPLTRVILVSIVV